jgi:hypothetical protein
MTLLKAILDLREVSEVVAGENSTVMGS